MVTNQTFIIYIQQIAALFCTTANMPTLCKANVKNRIKTYLNDEIFENYFLPFLHDGLFYSYKYSHNQGTGGGYKKIFIKGFDVVNGKNKDSYIEGVPSGEFNNGDWRAIFNRNGLQLLGIAEGRFVVRRPGYNYGIVFVPPQPGGSGGSGTQCGAGFVWNENLQKCLPVTTPGGGVIITPPGSPGSPAPTGLTPEAISGFDFESLLIPALIVGAGVVVFNLMQK